MPFWIVKSGPMTEAEAAAALSEDGEGAVLVRGEAIPFKREVVVKVVIDSRTLPLFPEAAVEAPLQVEAPKLRNPRTGKYGGKSVPDQVRDYLVARAPQAFKAADIAADIGCPRMNVNAAIARLRKAGVIAGNGAVHARAFTLPNDTPSTPTATEAPVTSSDAVTS